MRRLTLGAGVLVLALASAGTAWAAADCPNGLTLKKFGVTEDANGDAAAQVISSGAVNIKAIGWQCTSSACSYGLYNNASNSITVGDIGWEGGAAASGGDFIQFDSPIRFDAGVVLAGSNVAGVTVYACQAP